MKTGLDKYDKTFPVIEKIYAKILNQAYDIRNNVVLKTQVCEK